MSRKYKAILFCLLLIVILFIYSHASTLWQKNKTTPAVTITAQTITLQNATEYLNLIGTVSSYASVNIKSLVDGQILTVAFKQGQIVQPGDLLFKIDPRPYAIALTLAQANLARDNAQLHNTQLMLKRYRQLMHKAYIAPQDYDQIKANVAAATATVQADAAAVADAQLKLSYTEIKAPIGGRTGDVLVQAGNIIKSAEGLSLLSINQLNPIYVSFALPQEYLSTIQQQGAKAPLQITAFNDKNPEGKSRGELVFINNAIDTTTGTVQLKASFLNKDHLLWPGQFVKVQLPLAFLQRALIVPNAAVQIGQDGAYLFIAGADRKAHYRKVQTGATVQAGTVITEGLQAGEQVITDGQFLLSDGTPIKTVAPL